MNTLNTLNTLNYKDILFNIKSYLHNKDIIELLLTSKILKDTIGHKNIFTSICIKRDSNICNMIRLYLKHKTSIITTIINDSYNPYDIWPFYSNKMIFINCNIGEDYLNKNYRNKENNINIIVIDRKYQHFWP
jgi:hypothetical protein